MVQQHNHTMNDWPNTHAQYIQAGTLIVYTVDESHLKGRINSLAQITTPQTEKSLN